MCDIYQHRKPSLQIALKRRQRVAPSPGRFKNYVIFNKFCYFWHFFTEYVIFGQILLFLSNFVIFSILCYSFFKFLANFCYFWHIVWQFFFTNCVSFNNCCCFWLLLFLTNFVIFEKCWYFWHFFHVWQIKAKNIKIKITRVDHFMQFFSHMFLEVCFVFFAINLEIILFSWILDLSDHPDNQLSQITTNQNP